MVIVFGKPRSIAANVLAVQAVVVVAVVVLSVGLAYRQADHLVEETTRTRVLAISQALAATDDVRTAVTSPDPAGRLADAVGRELARTGADFIVVMSPDGTRYTHPNPDLVGGEYVGTIAPARDGGTVIEDYVGSLGLSTRAVVPVFVDGEVVGLVSVGLRRTRVDSALRALVPDIALAGATVAVLSGLGAWVAARRVRTQTRGLNARELQRLHDHHEAVLHAVQEGLVITDTEGRLQVVNEEARRLLGLREEDVGRHLADLALAEGLREMISSPDRYVDVPHVSGGRSLLVSSGPVRRQQKVVAALTTLRDRTELEDLTGRLSQVNELAGALHAQAHEAANRLHTVITLIELGRSEDAVGFATEELRAGQRLQDAVLGAVAEPSVAALLLGKTTQAAEHGIRLELDPEAHLPQGALPPRHAVTILGNLIDNAIDALAGTDEQSEKVITLDAQVENDQLILTVADTGPGLLDEAHRHAFEKGWTTKAASGPEGRGLGLALVQQTAQLLGGSVSVGNPPGASFTVTVPVTAPATTSARSEG